MDQVNLSESKRKTKLNQLLLVWVILIVLSLLGAIIADFSQITPILLITVLGFLVIKAQLVIDIFMNLGPVKWGWRLSMSAFAVMISLLVGLLS
ncbi:MAG: cytochrome C oxidase subunit IV family protein [Kangiellaceae bacterium]|nr:cytochrome C oxidase subunit IV family protein [Kangiellaceae bacterium]